MYKSFTEMNVWKLAMDLAVEVFQLTASLPKTEDYGLTSQIRRSSTSISANVAEAFGKRTLPDKRKFYDISRGSAFETISHLIYGNKVGYFDAKKVKELTQKLETIIHELNKVMSSFQNK